MTVIGVLHPGEMGGAVAAALAAAGHEVLWASAGRSTDTARRAGAAGAVAVGDIDALVARSQVILSICPPHAAGDVAGAVSQFDGVYVDANAVAPANAADIAKQVEAAGADYVDGAIIGPPPRRDGTTRLYLSGASAADIAALFAGTPLQAIVVEGAVTAASALKMAYAGWTKGSAALMLAVQTLAREHGVADALAEEWELSQPGLRERAHTAADSAATKGWRWSGEMRQIAETMDGAGLPAGFHEAAAEIYDRAPRLPADADTERLWNLVLEGLLRR